MRILKRSLFILSLVIVGTLLAVFIFISPITKYLIQKYDVKFSGREITMDWVFVNLLTGYVHFNDLVIYEYQNDSVFFKVNGLTANLSLMPLLSGKYEFSKVVLTKPKGYLVQSGKQFNFSDLITTFSTDTLNVDTSGPPLAFSMLNIEIEDGEFHYDDITTPVHYYIKNVNIKSDGYRYNVDTIPIEFSFLSGPGSGAMQGELSLNTQNKNYRLDVQVKKFDLEIINQYMKDLTNYGNFAAMLDADILSTGNLSTVDSITVYGGIHVTKFHFGKNKKEDFASFDRLDIEITKICPKEFLYVYDSVSLVKPFFKYERYDVLDNLQTMFGKGGENIKAVNANSDKFNLAIEIVQFVKKVFKNIVRSEYKLDRFALYEGDFQFRDYSLGERFAIEMQPFFVFADSIDKNHKRVDVSVHSGIKPYGNFQATLSINPHDSSDFDLFYRFEQLALTTFNPYLVTHTSYALDRGGLEFVGKWNVRNGDIKSTNHLIVLDPRVSDRKKNNDNKWIPISWVMAFVRDRGNVIDYEIPITGNLKSPHVSLRDIFLDLLKNIFVKPATWTYRTELKRTERQLEKSLQMKWNMNKSELTYTQRRVVKKLERFLEDHPEARITIRPTNYELKEKEFILLYEVKKKYFLAHFRKKDKHFSSDDSVYVSMMSIKDPAFNRFLNALVKDKTLFTVQHKAARLISESYINKKFNQLNQGRKQVFLNLIKNRKVIQQISFLNSRNTIPYNGFSYYDISYNGIIPDYLSLLFAEMKELNNEQPRESYKRKRKINTVSPQL